MNDLISRLNSLMADKDLSLEKAAKIIGCSTTQLWRWIHGQVKPGEMSILAIEQAIGKIERLPSDKDFLELVRQRDLYRELSKKISTEEKFWLMSKANLYGQCLKELAKRHGVEIPPAR
jgi:transcriptional regulator with XRE-family HTH domain